MSGVLCSLCGASVPSFETYPHEMGPICEVCEQERSSNEMRVYLTIGSAIGWPVFALCYVALVCLSGGMAGNGSLFGAAFLIVSLGFAALTVGAAFTTVTGAVRLASPGNFPIAWVVCALWGGVGIVIGGLFSIIGIAVMVASLFGGG